MAGWGRLGLWVALVAGVAAAVAPLVGRRPWARRLAGLSCAGGVVAVAVLARALVGADTSFVYVADFSRRGASAPYRLAGLWGGMAGSLLWLATLVGLAGTVTAWRLRDRRRQGDVAAVTGATVATLVMLVVAFADPFATLALPPVDGAGLTPILEHPAMLYHPPLLYLGLATLVGPFAVTVSALAARRLDDDWSATVRRGLLVPWVLLGVGMVAGAHWAYVELGWGGYWAWDPVENTALLPWLAVTVALHAARGRREPRPPASRVAVAALVCLPFVLALVGSLLTRSGATSSVHAFAESRAIGRALAGVVVVVTVGVSLLVHRARRPLPPVPEPAAGPRPAAAAADEVGNGSGRVTVAGLVAGHLALVGTALAVVLAGSLWPLWADLRGGDGIAVEGSYFAQFVGPLAAAALVAICLVPVALRREGRTAQATVLLPAAAGALVAVLVLATSAPRTDVWRLALAGAAGACMTTATVAAVRSWRSSPRRAVGGHLAHAALGLAVLGIAGTASGGRETVSLRPGETTDVLGHTITLQGTTVEDGPVAGSEAVVATVTADGTTLRPSLVAYPDRGVLLAETSLRSTPAGDVQVTLQSADDDGRALLDVGVHPLQVLVWWGGLGVVAAGLVAARDGRRRTGPAVTSGAATEEAAATAPSW